MCDVGEDLSYAVFFLLFFLSDRFVLGACIASSVLAYVIHFVPLESISIADDFTESLSILCRLHTMSRGIYNHKYRVFNETVL